MSVYDKGLITILVCGAIFIVVAIPLILRRVPRNRIYGYRTHATLSDDTIWYDVNAYFAVRFLVLTIISATTAIALHAWRGIAPSAWLNVSVVLLAAPVVIAWLLTARHVRSRYPERRAPGPGRRNS